MDKIELLKQYKELLDSGILTQEEFDAKKKQVLESPDEVTSSGSSGGLDSLLKSAKEKSEQAKEKANEKLEELRKKQAEEQEKRKAAEEERKKQEEERKKQEEERQKAEAELQAQRAEAARIAKEEKERIAEEKRKEKAERKEQNKQKRKAFFAKKSTKAVIALICLAAVGLVAWKAYSYATREKLIGAFDEKDKYSINGLTYYIPKGWEKSDISVIDLLNDESSHEEETYTHNDKNNKFLGAVSVSYLGEEIPAQSVINDIKDKFETEDYELTSGGNKILVSKIPSASHNDLGDSLTMTIAVSEKDYATFAMYVLSTIDAYDKDTVDAILTAPEFGSYKNPKEADTLTVQYTGSREGGYTASSKDFDVTINYKDGSSQKSSYFSIEPSNPAITDGGVTNVTVKCHGVELPVELKGRTVKSLTAKYSGNTEAGTEISKGNSDLTVTVEWDDGTKETVTDYTMKGFKLKAGETSEETITAYGETCTLKVECTTMSKAQYKDKCTTRSYKELLRNASYGEYTKIYGKVLQDCGSGYYRISSGGSSWDDVYMVSTSEKLVEDDWVNCYGMTGGIYEYTTVMGASQKVPMLYADYVDIK